MSMGMNSQHVCKAEVKYDRIELSVSLLDG